MNTPDIPQKLPHLPLEALFKANSAEFNYEQFGRFVCANFTIAQQNAASDFAAYQDRHNMAEVLSNLKSGMDALSLNYIDTFEDLICACRLNQKCLINRNALWTDEDRRLFAHYKEVRNSGKMPFLDMVNLDWGSNITCAYGLYDTDPALLQKLNGRDVIDGGGFIGDTIHVFRQLFPDSPMYIFEPAQQNIDEMRRLFAESLDNPENKLFLFKKALGESAGSIKINSNSANPSAAASTHFSFSNAGAVSEEVETVTLDGFIKEHKLNPGVIKLDVEGAEPEILKGAVESIKEFRPLIIAATYHTPEEYYETKPFLESLNLGYSFRIRRSSITNAASDAVLIAVPEK